jgi:hypothetical protein
MLVVILKLISKDLLRVILLYNLYIEYRVNYDSSK